MWYLIFSKSAAFSPFLFHQAFEVEIANHRARNDAVIADGEDLLSSSNFAANDIQTQLKAVRNGWSDLQRQTALRIEMLEHSVESQRVRRIG